MITSLQNPKVKQVVKLRDRRDRDKSNQFLIEGYRELLRAVDSGHPVDTLFICEELFLGENEPALISRIQKRGAQIFPTTEDVFKKISYRDRPDGLLAIAPQLHPTLEEFAKSIEGNQNPFLVIAESIEKPGNLGTILRSSDAVGVDGVIISDRCTDLHNPNVVRASVGTLFTIPVIEAEGKKLIEWIKSRGIKVLAATPSAEANYTDIDLTGPLAIAVGTEQLGLSDLWMEEADLQVKIPMMGVADSLNVAMATTVLLYEALRQRTAKQVG
jgi:TrmH family RNA methyltransferase